MCAIELISSSGQLCRSSSCSSPSLSVSLHRQLPRPVASISGRINIRLPGGVPWYLGLSAVSRLLSLDGILDQSVYRRLQHHGQHRRSRIHHMGMRCPADGGRQYRVQLNVHANERATLVRHANVSRLVLTG